MIARVRSDNQIVHTSIFGCPINCTHSAASALCVPIKYCFGKIHNLCHRAAPLWPIPHPNRTSLFCLCVAEHPLSSSFSPGLTHFHVPSYFFFVAWFSYRWLNAIADLWSYIFGCRFSSRHYLVLPATDRTHKLRTQLIRFESDVRADQVRDRTP